jgi:hypothetical protein
MDWAAFQSCIADRLPGNPVVNDEEAVEKCVAKLTSDTAASAPKRRPHADPWPPFIVFRMKSLEEAVASHEGFSSESPGQPPQEVGNPSAERVDERTVERHTGIPGQ